MHLIPFDYLHERKDAPRGLVALAPMIGQARADGVANLLCDCGDFLQGSPLADEIAALRMLPHPMITAFNALAYDVVTLGNHDFEYGLGYLRGVLRDAAPCVVSANIRTGPMQTFVPPWTLIHRDIVCTDGQTRHLSVGVIGFAPPQITRWSADILQGAISTDDILSSARTHLPQLQRAGADIVVALCHGGPVSGPATAHMENAALQLAGMPGVDVVLMGHMHGVFPGCGFDGIADVDSTRGTLAGKPALMAGARGQDLGILDLTLTATQTRDDADRIVTRWQITDHCAQIKTAPHDTPADSALSRSLHKALAAPHAATLRRLREPLGQTAMALTSYFAPIGQDDSAALLAQVQIAEIREALRLTAFADLAILASTAPFHAGGHGGPNHYLDIPAGPLRVRDCAAIVPFNNPVCAVLRRGWQIRQWLERSSTYFRTVQPGAVDHPLLNALVPPYHFDSLHGLSYVIDLSASPEPFHNRIPQVTLNGRNLADDDLCVVATNSYRARGGGGLVSAEPSDTIHVTTDGLRTLLIRALRSGMPLPATAAATWSFAPMPGTSVLFPSSPTARDRLRDLPGVQFSHMQSDGFAAYRLTL